MVEKGAGVVPVAPECRFELPPAAFALFGKIKVDQTNTCGLKVFYKWMC